MKHSTPFVFVFLILSILTADAQRRGGGGGRRGRGGPPLTPEQRLASVQAPAGWNVSLYALPPQVNYPVAIATSSRGDLYVAVDQNSSLGRGPDRGRVIRCSDTDGDGKADAFVTVAEMDSPRGLWIDGGAVYVMHPPFLRAYHDDNGDGVSDRVDTLVSGLAYDLAFRGADHTVNGMRMGIDGFLYIAHGDYGSTNAVAKDGTAIKLYGGGIVRVRPDGTGLEIVSTGQRNIVDVAISPEMDLFTRDNTNDGGGWDVRLSQVIFTGEYGYPTLFKNFPGEIVAPMADYGGGSPTGALFLDEPGYFPEPFASALYTVEWGRNAILRHPLTPNGAGWKAGQETFVSMPRPTDMDVDGSGNLYLASWVGAEYNFAGDDVGFIVRLTPPRARAIPAFPDLSKAADAELLQHLGSASGFRRLYAQREILRRGPKPAFQSSLEQMASQHAAPVVRTTAIFTLSQLLGVRAQPALVRLSKQDTTREAALRSLADLRESADAIDAKPFVDALADRNPRVRLQAATALGRLGKKEQAGAILPLVADADPLIQHAAIKALVALQAADVCLAALGSSSPRETRLHPGASRVIQALHSPEVVTGLISTLDKTSTPATRRPLLSALARLYNREANWTSGWWGTRPDTTGPYFKPETWESSATVLAALEREIGKSDGETLGWLLVTLQKNRVNIPNLTETLVSFARKDAKFQPTFVDLYADRPTLPDEAIAIFGLLARSAEQPAAARAKAVRSLTRQANKQAALDAAVEGLTSQAELPDDLDQAWDEFAREGRHTRNVDYFIQLAGSGSPEGRALAYGVLTTLASARTATVEVKTKASQAIDAGFAQPESAAALLQAIARLELDDYGFQVRSLVNHSNARVAGAAKAAAASLKLDQAGAAAAGPRIETQTYEEIVAALSRATPDAAQGAALYVKAGCVACHTVSSNEAPKGPFLGGIATRYSKPELIESILKPNAKLAQGFETQWFKTGRDEEYEGFVTREGGEDLDVRNVAGITTTLLKKDITGRGRRELSIMPEGLMNPFTAADLASLLAYLESLPAN